MNAQVREATASYHRHRLLSPLVLSTGSITELTEVQVTVRVFVAGREATGAGSIYLSDLWAWPGNDVSRDVKEATLRNLCDDIRLHLGDYTGGEPAHPLELGLRLHHAVRRCDATVRGSIPPLAQAMCLSPFDAAIHDAVGQALDRSAFAIYSTPAVVPSADAMFPEGGACEAIQRMLLPEPRRELPAWLIVGKADDLPRDVRPWVVERGYSHFKLKIMGKSAADDASRTAELYRAATSWGLSSPRLSVDSNEGNPDAQSVLEYLENLRRLDRDAFEALMYLEQPTGRDIHLHRYDWLDVTRLKPVLLDEGLTDLELLPEAMSQGWSGLALKTCKGHSFALVAAAWAHQHGMLLSLQDLTNPGASFIHAALLGAHLPTINGVELNSPQFTPAANARWVPRLGELFAPKDGQHRLPSGSVMGLGSRA